METTAATSAQASVAAFWQWLDAVCDPEIPVLTVLDMGVVRRLVIRKGRETFYSTIEKREHSELEFPLGQVSLTVEITPTYTGCPAMNMIAASIRMEFVSRGLAEVSVVEILSPAWTTDWIPEPARQKLREYGIAPPENRQRAEKLLFSVLKATCPHCGSSNTEQISAFGSTACKSLHRCLDCREPFDYFKCH